MKQKLSIDIKKRNVSEFIEEEKKFFFDFYENFLKKVIIKISRKISMKKRTAYYIVLL